MGEAVGLGPGVGEWSGVFEAVGVGVGDGKGNGVAVGWSTRARGAGVGTDAWALSWQATTPNKVIRQNKKTIRRNNMVHLGLKKLSVNSNQ